MAERSLFDRALMQAAPRPVAEFRPPPTPLGDGLWSIERRLRHFGLALLPSRTTIVRLANRSLVVVSPPPLVDARTCAEIDSLGSVEHVVIPNSFHYLYARDFLAHYPEACLLAAPALGQRIEGADFGEELGPRPPAGWSGELEHAILGPDRGVSEVILFHRRSGTLILTDLAFNMTRYPRALDRVVWRMSGIPGDFGPGRTSRAVLLRDRALAARVLSRVAQWPIARIVVAHGDVIEDDAPGRFRRAFTGFLNADAATGTPT